MKRAVPLVVCVLICIFAMYARAGASVEGSVQLPKTRAPLPAAKYKDKIEVGTPDGPAAVVYLEGHFPASSATNSAAKVRLEQKRYQFAPGILAIQKGTAVEFPNLDDGYHNVFSYSKPKRFDLGRYRKDEQPPALVFDKAGVIKLYCEIHEHMRGTIVVLDTPHFVKTDATGKYRLENLPPGKHALKVWVDEKRTWEKAVHLVDGETLKVDFPGN
jgi:plastocyanin